MRAGTDLETDLPELSETTKSRQASELFPSPLRERARVRGNHPFVIPEIDVKKPRYSPGISLLSYKPTDLRPKPVAELFPSPSRERARVRGNRPFLMPEANVKKTIQSVRLRVALQIPFAFIFVNPSQTNQNPTPL